MLRTNLGVNSRACFGFRIEPENAWGLAVNFKSEKECTDDLLEWLWGISGGVLFASFLFIALCVCT